MPKGFLMMTALPPTKGHMALIQWARAYCRSVGISDLHVMVCSQPEEPFHDRYRAIDAALDYDRVLGNPTPSTWVHMFHKTMPQVPEDDSLFWAKWQAEIFKTVGEFSSDDIVFSSEAYGFPLAKVLGCAHVPYDIGRTVVNTKATRVRENPLLYFSHMLPTVQSRFRKTVTIFGAESTGKTTLARELGLWKGHVLPEWARPYLESLPSPETTDERMEVIVHGQRATEQAAKALVDRPFIIRDTDLLSTIGYYGLYSPHHIPPVAVDKADLYIVCPSNIPFAADPLRYGGDKRESSDEYWIELLEKWNCNYVVLQETDYFKRSEEAYQHMRTLFLDNPLWRYKR